MNKPKIIVSSRSKHKVELTLAIEESLEYFQGHFPSSPILPGVVQVGWAIEFGLEYFEIEKKFSRLDVVKFIKVIVPSTSMILLLNYYPDKERVNFSYDWDGAQYSSGQITFS